MDEQVVYDFDLEGYMNTPFSDYVRAELDKFHWTLITDHKSDSPTISWTDAELMVYQMAVGDVKTIYTYGDIGDGGNDEIVSTMDFGYIFHRVSPHRFDVQTVTVGTWEGYTSHVGTDRISGRIRDIARSWFVGAIVDGAEGADDEWVNPIYTVLERLYSEAISPLSLDDLSLQN